MMEVKHVHSAERSVLKLEGKWSVERAHELKELLMRTMKTEARIVIDLSELTDADLSCLQLLCAAHRTSLKLEKHLTLHENKPEVFMRLVRDAGFARTLGCHKDPHKSCLWMEGGRA